MKKNRFTIHSIESYGEEPMYALAVHDPNAPDADAAFLLGTDKDVRSAYEALARFIETGKHAGIMDDFDERLGMKWLTVPEATALSRALSYPVSAPSIRRAASLGRIRGAKREGRDWRFPQARFLHWIRNPAEHKTGPKKDETG